MPLGKQNPWLKKKESCIRAALFFCAALSLLITFGIIWVLIDESLPFFKQVGLGDFFFGTQWTPMFEPKQFGILPLLCGTFLVALGAAVVAIPLGMASALFLSEYASTRIRSYLKPTLELLAGIPTIVYGYFALTFVTPIITKIYPNTNVFNAASAAIVVGIMILPMIASLSDDAMRSVPNSLRYAAFALGATRFEVASRIVTPGAFSGITASFVLALSRAIGETMVVALAAGSTPKLTLNPFESIQTMTGFIVQVSLGDTPAGSLVFHTIFAVGLMLFLITFVMNLIAQSVLGRFRERYE
jgi:phosphate transport system permease protein